MTYDIVGALALVGGVAAKALIKAGVVQETIKTHGEALVRIETKVDQLLLAKAARDV